MVIEFYAGFGKRLNSTKLPGSGVTVRTLTGYLREPTSIMNPVIKIERLPNDGTPTIYTYAYVPSFYRYYFVRDWRWVDGLWECDMEEDVLASFKTEIGNCNEYILRTDSASNTGNFNTYISDKEYPATTNFTVEHTSYQNPFVTVLSQGTYVVGIISGEASDSIGAITYFAMTPREFGTLKQTLFSDTNLEKMNLLDHQTLEWLATELSQDIFRTMYNPYQYIASCMWFPLTQSQFTGSPESGIKIGWWDYNNLSGVKLTQQVLILNDGIDSIPEHPQSSARGVYLNYSPYTKRTLYGKFGSLPIDTALLGYNDFYVGVYNVDVITGKCVYQAFKSDNIDGLRRKLIGKTEFLLGVPIQLAQVGMDYMGIAVTAIQAGTSGWMQGIGGIAKGVYNTVESAMPQMETSGTNGSFVSAFMSTELVSTYYLIAEENIEHVGRPLYEHRVINTLSGYIQCAEGDISFSCFSDEKEKISQFFTQGFFWE